MWSTVFIIYQRRPRSAVFMAVVQVNARWRQSTPYRNEKIETPKPIAKNVTDLSDRLHLLYKKVFYRRFSSWILSVLDYFISIQVFHSIKHFKTLLYDVILITFIFSTCPLLITICNNDGSLFYFILFYLFVCLSVHKWKQLTKMGLYMH